MSIADRAAKYVELMAPMVSLTQVVNRNLRNTYHVDDPRVASTFESCVNYATRVHNKCNGYLIRLRYGKRRNGHTQLRESLRKLRAEAAKLLP